MAVRLSDDEKLRTVLNIFKRSGLRLGQGLIPDSFITGAGMLGVRTSDIADGVDIGIARGLLEDGPNDTVRLTEAGIAQITASHQRPDESRVTPRRGAPGFAEGWSDGWKSICGANAAVPPAPALTVPSSANPYQYGYEQGRAVAGGK